jgi:hypothetical protein
MKSTEDPIFNLVLLRLLLMFDLSECNESWRGDWISILRVDYSFYWGDVYNRMFGKYQFDPFVIASSLKYLNG